MFSRSNSVIGREGNSNSRPSGIHPNSRVKATQCALCNKGFSLLHKQHECKRCLRPVCHYCGEKKTIVLSYDMKVEHRVCDVCRDEMSQIQTWKSRAMVFFNRNSTIAKKWMSYLQQKDDEKAIEQSYQNMLDQVKKTPNENVKTVIQQDLIPTLTEIKNEMNYSFYDTHLLLMGKDNEDVLMNCLNNILRVFYESNPVCLNKYLVQIIVFLLYFCSEAYTLKILQIIHKEIIPLRFQYHKIKNTLIDVQSRESEVVIILEILKESYQMNTQDQNLIKKYIEKQCIPILSSLTLNHLNFNCCFLVFEQFMWKRDFYHIEASLAAIFKMHHTALIQQTYNNDFADYLVKQTEYTKLKTLSQKDMVRKSTSAQPISNFNSMENIEYPKFEKQISLETNIPIEQNFLNTQEVHLLNSVNDYLSQEEGEYQLIQDERGQSENQKVCQEIIRKIKLLKEAVYKLNLDQQRIIYESDSKVAEISGRVDIQQTQDYDSKVKMIIQLKDNEIDELKIQIEQQKTQYFELETRYIQSNRKNQPRKDRYQDIIEQQDKLINQQKSEKNLLEVKFKDSKNHLDQMKIEYSLLKNDMIKHKNTMSQLNSINAQLKKQLQEQQNLTNDYYEENKKVNEQLKIQQNKREQKPTEIDDLYKGIETMKHQLMQKQKEIYDLRIQLIQIQTDQINLQEQAELTQKAKDELVKKLENMQDALEVKNYYETKLALMSQQQQEQLSRLMDEFGKNKN